MKRKLLLAVLAIVVTVSCAVGLTACNLFGEETSHKHQMQHVDAVAATCTEDGNTEYWYCSDCGKYFSDAEGKNEIADLNSTVISAKGHDLGEWETAKAATCTEDGYKERECSVCHETEQETITATGHTFSEDWSHDETLPLRRPISPPLMFATIGNAVELSAQSPPVEDVTQISAPPRANGAALTPCRRAALIGLQRRTEKRPRRCAGALFIAFIFFRG